jgi:hypothetical protein
MVVVGFDMSKDKIYGARLDRSGTVKERVVLTNSEREIEVLLRRLKSHYRHLFIASEATAEYHRPLALTCLRLGRQDSNPTLLGSTWHKGILSDTLVLQYTPESVILGLIDIRSRSVVLFKWSYSELC